MKSKREFLFVLLAVLTGCLQDEQAETGKEVAVHNNQNANSSISVTLLNSGEVVFEETYPIESGKADESRSVSDPIDTVRVSVENGPTTEEGYNPPASCRSPSVIVQVKESEIIIGNGC